MGIDQGTGNRQSQAAAGVWGCIPPAVESFEHMRQVFWRDSDADQIPSRAKMGIAHALNIIIIVGERLSS